jgi:GNAT superfamily N-acetyltransferase
MNSTQKASTSGQFSQRALRTLSSQGLAGMAQRIVSRLKHKPHLKDGYVLVVCLKDMVQAPPPTIDLELKELSGAHEDDIQALAKLGIYRQSKADILQYLADGWRCYLAKYKGQVVGYYWTSSGEFYDYALNRRFQLADDEEFQLGAYVLPEFRGQGILPYLIAETAHARAQRHPGLRAVVFIDVNNKSSLRSTHKIGYTIVGRVGFVELFCIRFHYLWARNVLPKTTRRFFLQLF